MAAGDELSIVDVWLQSTLAGDATLAALAVGGVHNTEAPPGSSYPLVIHQHQGSSDRAEHGALRVHVNGLWLVKAVAKTRDYGGTLGQLTARIDALLHRRTGSVAGGVVFSCVREQPFRMPERTEDGQDFRHAGGLYRLLVQST